MEKDPAPPPAPRNRGLLAPLAVILVAVLLHDALFRYALTLAPSAVTLVDFLDCALVATLAIGLVVWYPVRRSRDAAAAARSAETVTARELERQSYVLANNLLAERMEEHERELAASHAALARENEERAYAEDKLRRVSTTDNLTGLYKRGAFITQLDALRSGSGATVAVIFIDIDHFKLVNDGLGDTIADRVLIALSERLRRIAPESALIGRVGGDEFAVACEIESSVLAQTMGESILETLSMPIAIDGQRIHTSSSIGVRVSSVRDERAATLLRDAHTAMHRSKHGGRARIVVFDAAMREEVKHQYALNSDLHQAVLHEQISVEYQPIHDLRDGRVLAFEALARWDHPGRGRIDPGVFIPAAEDNGLVAAIGASVLRDACEQIRAHGVTPETPIGINLSARQLAQAGICESISQVLAEYAIAPETILFEVTESTIVESLHMARDILLRLKELGFRIAIDDFGTGYSSLSYLRSLPFDVLKIDRAFVRHIDTEEHSRDIVRMIVTLAESLDLSVVAEGIETTAQMIALRDLGCHRGQGFLFSIPLPAGVAFTAPALTELVSRA